MKSIQTQSIFQAIDDSGQGAISAGSINTVLESAGIAIGDARLSTLRARLKSMGDTAIDNKAFTSLLENSGSLVSRTVKGELVVPEFDEFAQQIQSIYDDIKPIEDGAVADYIPQLARVNADSFGVSICTIDGQQLHVGDTADGFTLQSSCKPILYCAALDEHGEDKVHTHVGREPSGLSFNELTLNKGVCRTIR
jgi:glutaminase